MKFSWISLNQGIQEKQVNLKMSIKLEEIGLEQEQNSDT